VGLLVVPELIVLEIILTLLLLIKYNPTSGCALGKYSVLDAMELEDIVNITGPSDKKVTVFQVMV